MSNHSLQPPSTVCEQTQEAILALLDNEFSNALSQEEQAMLAEHLPQCPACQEYQQSMQHLTLSLSQIEEVPVPEGLELRIMDRIASQAQPAEENATADVVNLSNVRPDAPKALASRKPLWPKMVPIAAAVLTVALSLPLIYQAINPGKSIEKEDHPLIPATGQTVASLPGKQLGSASSIQFSPIDNTEVNTTMPRTSAEAIRPEHQPARQMNETSLNTTGKGQPDESLASNPDATRQPQNDSSLEVAAALPATMNTVANTYASSEEGDIYFDPLSNVVDF